MLGDAAYTNTDHLISPYKAPLTQNSSNCRFNRKLSSLRIDIEHAFGILKGRWGSLVGLRILLRLKNLYKFAVKWITACCVLHNILVNIRDQWERNEGW